MRRISFAFMSTLAAVIMLFGYRTSTPNPTSVATTTVAASGSSTGTTTTPAAPTTSPSTTSSTPSTTASPSPTASPSATAGTVTGQTVQTRWGPVQVQLSVAGGKVTSVTVLQQPTGNGKDVQINNAALPVLKQETLKAQSASIDTVSGATVTSDGYITSLQSALDSAGL